MRLGMLPPGIRPDWEDNPAWVQSLIIAYGQIKDMEESSRDFEFLSLLLKSMVR